LDAFRIAELLDSYIVGLTLPPGIFDQLSVYLDLLLRWNAKTNLTAIRDPEQIVTRHFGESLFAAGVLFGPSSRAGIAAATGVEGPAVSAVPEATHNFQTTLADLGSGAGFPGIPMKLALPRLHVTLIESQNKKATFLKEVIRTLRLEGIEVYNGRAERWGKQTDIVTLRAVERFERVLSLAVSLMAPGGRLCLLIGRSQTHLLSVVKELCVEVGRIVPGTDDSMVIVGKYIEK
jgi:16S rRNA (guanine527-N7)-methyltransferase